MNPKIVTQSKISFPGYIDWIINPLKWPIAALSLYFLPACWVTFWTISIESLQTKAILPFSIGIFMFWATNKMLGRTVLWNWLRIFEHEFVHLIFGLACLKKPVRWHVSSREGYIGFNCPSNWLVTISPYIFPLIPVVCYLLVSTINHFSPLHWMILPASMGFAVACHVAFTWIESEFTQPDIEKVGSLFAIVVSPSIHLVFMTVALEASMQSKGTLVESTAKVIRQIGSNGFGSNGSNGDGWLEPASDRQEYATSDSRQNTDYDISLESDIGFKTNLTKERLKEEQGKWYPVSPSLNKYSK
ncbi:MAG: hypothetical protein MPJ24_06900 [Pirellulaceae bacterium]|nr:hypothetical protein [Pirellulaceae bacterium]